MFKRIWLQMFDEKGEAFQGYNGDITWCKDKINDEDIEYVHVSEIERLREENARYRAALEAIDNEDTYSAAVLYSIAAEALKEQDNG